MSDSEGGAVARVGLGVLVMPNAGLPAELGERVRDSVDQRLHDLGFRTRPASPGGLGGGVHLDAVMLEGLKLAGLYLGQQVWQAGKEWRQHQQRQDLPRVTVHLRLNDVELSRSLMPMMPGLIADIAKKYDQVCLEFIYSLLRPNGGSAHASLFYPLRRRSVSELERQLESGSRGFVDVAWRPSWWPWSGVNPPRRRPKRRLGKA